MSFDYVKISQIAVDVISVVVLKSSVLVVKGFF